MSLIAKVEVLRTKRLILRLKWKYQNFVSFEIFRKISDISPIGEVSYFLTGELVYTIFTPYRGAGYATETLNAISDFFKQYDASKILFLRIRKENIASNKVAKKAGFVEVENAADGKYSIYYK